MIVGKITEWRKFATDATSECAPQFQYILSENGLEDLDYSDIFYRACNRYAGYLKLTNHRAATQRYFTEMWALHGVANQFSIKDAKWLSGLLINRTRNKENVTIDNMQTILYWVALRYNFWLGQQLYS